MTGTLGKLWSDAVTVRRTGETYPCRLSRSRRPAPYTEYADIHTQEAGFVLYCAPDADIRAGDFLDVRRGEKIFRGYAARPMPYASHLEVGLTDTEAV